ncbi:MAG: hypothetical protein K2M95_04045 [Clostridiales bacterium]|nr:hypothetical protein [Clostridiales bacterium]
MLVFLCIAILLLWLIALPIRVGVNFYVDVFNNRGFIKVYLFGIRIFYAAIHFEHNKSRHNDLVLEHGKKESKIHLNTDADDKKSVAAMMKNPVGKNLMIHKLSAHFTVGKTQDAFFTVTLLQWLRVLFYTTAAPIKCRYNTHITESFTPEYNRDVLESDIIGIIGISIANIICSYLTSIFKNKRKQEMAKI